MAKRTQRAKVELAEEFGVVDGAVCSKRVL
jgi:hypothetical protein